MKRFKGNNSVISLFVSGQLNNVTNISKVLTVAESELITVPKLLSFSHELQYTLAAIWGTFLVVGSYFRYIFYKYLYEQHKNKSKKTIDRLFLVIALLHHIFIITATIEVTLKVFGQSTLKIFQIFNKSNGTIKLGDIR